MEFIQRSIKARYELKTEDYKEKEEEALLVSLLEQYRNGKTIRDSTEENEPEAAIVAEPPSREEEEEEEERDGPHGSKLAFGGTSSISTGTEMCIDEIRDVQFENTADQNDSIGKTENWFAENSTNLPNTEQLRNKSQQNAEVGEIEEEKNLNLKYAEKLDLEELLATQETHDLYCPSCYSCITKRVIIKKRRRGQHDFPKQPKREKLEVTDEPESPFKETVMSPDFEEEREVFRCLSCLRFFIRLGTGFGFFSPSCDENTVASTLDGTEKKQSRWYSLFGKKEGEPVRQSVDGRDRPNSESGHILPSESIGQATENQELEKPYGDRASMIAPSDGAVDKPGDDPTAENPTSSVMQRPPKPSRIFWGWKPGINTDHVADNDTVEVNIDSETSTAEERPKENLEPLGLVLEILKSIVYGGLAETITSLGVVSSAAGSGASTLNILALGLANLVGGLIVLAHNLRDLRTENTGLVTRLSEEQEDRYRELLGRRENFRLHVFLAVSTYIFFGLIPPLVYAFSFHQTGIKNYKLISVFSVSLVCVILLTIGKVYVRKPPKSYIKTVAYYASIAVTSSGISFIIGDVAAEFLKNLGWLKPNQAGMTSVLEAIKPGEPGFASF